MILLTEDAAFKQASLFIDKFLCVNKTYEFVEKILILKENMLFQDVLKGKFYAFYLLKSTKKNFESNFFLSSKI